jgi:hypothetical protein
VSRLLSLCVRCFTMSKRKKIAHAVFLLVLLLFLGRETGLYNFHWTSSNAQSHMESSVTTHNYRSGFISISNIAETPSGAKLTFSDGSTVTLTINNITYSGMYYLPIVKHISASMKASFATSDHRITGEYAVNTTIDIKGTCSIRFARQAARVTCMNMILSDIRKRL